MDCLQSTLSSDSSLAAVVVPSTSTSSTTNRHLIQIYQVGSAPASCSLQSTLTHSSDQSTLTELIFCGSSLLVALFGTVEVVVWDLNRGVVSNKFRTQDEDSAFYAVSSSSEDSFYLLTRFGPKLYVQEYNEKGKVTRKIKGGKWEEDAVDEMGLAVTKSKLVVKSSSGIRIMELDTAKKLGKIKAKNALGKISVCSNKKKESILAVLESAGSVVLYSLPEGKEMARVAHDMTAGSKRQTTLQLESKDDQYVLLVDSTVYNIDASSSSFDKLTKLSTANSGAALLLCQNKLLALVQQKMGGCQSKWLDLDDLASSVSLDKEDEKEGKGKTKDTSKRKAENSQPMIMGPGQAGLEPSQPVLKKPRVDEADKEAESSEKEISVAERLQQLAEELDKDYDDDDEADNDEERPAVVTSFKAKNATTESLKEFLTQALQSGDESLLELALGVRDNKVIKTTIQEIDASLVELLLGRLTTKLASNPMRAEALAKWISVCLRTGVRFQPDHLAPLRNLIYERVESYSDLLHLQGRLSMMCDVE